MGIYDRQILTAKRLLFRNGQSVTWREPAAPITAPTGPAQPWKPTAGIPTDYPDTRIAFFPNTKENRETLHYSNDTDIPAGSEIGLMGAVDFNPTLKGIVIRPDGQQLRVKSISPIKPNGEIILYTIDFDV